MMGVACSGVTKRGVFSTKMKPSASAPASTAVIASRRFVMPQTLTRIMNNGGGETPPPFPPRLARSDSERPQPPRLPLAESRLPFPARLTPGHAAHPPPPPVPPARPHPPPPP